MASSFSTCLRSSSCRCCLLSIIGVLSSSSSSSSSPSSGASDSSWSPSASASSSATTLSVVAGVGKTVPSFCVSSSSSPSGMLVVVVVVVVVVTAMLAAASASSECCAVSEEMRSGFNNSKATSASVLVCSMATGGLEISNLGFLETESSLSFLELFSSNSSAFLLLVSAMISGSSDALLNSSEITSPNFSGDSNASFT
ncbi:hypothetical protein WICPIJ_001242 [Wickerhamomyces pijperi]|uniref:Uncharacterized protein n=1 Tax=Wickerhamomyces pijperi TaxID=599730 RepID=A0A9P8QE72_WICPI|nr:hypothetical protein WICPIJ_001242 [Wickerhamomyces pijperi]